MSTGQMILLLVTIGLLLVAVMFSVIWATVFLVQRISMVLSTTLSTSFQTATSPGAAEQATETWQTLTTVPWEDWNRPGETSTEEPPV